MYTDPIADMLTRIRNANMARKRIVEIPCSNVKVGIAQVLLNAGYIQAFKKFEDSKQGVLKIALKYDPINRTPAIQKIVRASRPGLRYYSPALEIPRVMNGLGISVLSTSRGVMTGQEAKALNIGGEVLCYVS